MGWTKESQAKSRISNLTRINMELKQEVSKLQERNDVQKQIIEGKYIHPGHASVISGLKDRISKLHASIAVKDAEIEKIKNAHESKIEHIENGDASFWHGFEYSISPRATSVLKKADIVWVSDFLELTYENFGKHVSGCGPKTWAEIVEMQKAVRHRKKVKEIIADLSPAVFDLVELAVHKWKE